MVTSTIDVFLTFGRGFSQPLLADVVRKYLLVHEIDILLTTGLDALSANVPCQM